MSNEDEVFQELAKAQKDLADALEELKSSFWSKLNVKERKAIESEFEQANTLIERLKSGMVWIAFFGKTSAGKSSVINSLLGEDLAEVDPRHGTTKRQIVYPYQKHRWMLVDVPGILDGGVHEQIALDEANKAHGLVFVIDGEPYHDELELFKRLHEAYPTRPIIVFVNKLDILELNSIPAQEHVRQRIHDKMSQFVARDEDIVYGSASLRSADRKTMVRQDLPQLLDRLYDGPGELGTIVSLIDPAGRALNITSEAHKKILGVRKRVARIVINSFCLASAAETFLPLSWAYATPATLVAMVATVLRIMNFKTSEAVYTKIANDLGKIILQEMGIDIAVSVILETALDTLILTGIGAIIGIAGTTTLIGTKMYRTAVLGELTIRYVEEGGTWEGKDRHQIILDCYNNVNRLYGLLGKDNK